MSAKVLYSKQSLRDLDRIWEEVYSASQSPDLTERYLNDLLDKIEAKAEYPDSGSPLYYEDLFTGYRFIVFKSYIAFYHFDEENLYIDRVIYRKSDYLQKLIPGTFTEE